MRQRIEYSDGTTPSICIVGAGFAGLTAGIKLKTELGLTSFTIFDQNEDVGGTWLVNTYPGCACDIPSHLYSWSFEPNPDWTHGYACQQDILEYMKRVTRKYDLYGHFKFKSSVKTQVWVESIRKWKIRVWNQEANQVEEHRFDMIINGVGALREKNIPEQFAPFQGPILHSAQWDSTIKLENKVVAVIGTGASAVQLIPALAPNVKELHCYQRRAAWVVPRYQHKFPKLVKWMFTYIPFLLRIFRWLLFLINELIFYPSMVYGSWMNKFLSYIPLMHLQSLLRGAKNSALRTKLTPDYTPGCKRVMVSDDYFPAFQLPNVTLNNYAIVEVKANGILTANGKFREIDVLVLGTGFRAFDYFAPLSITGKNSTDILTAWNEQGPSGYLGITFSNMPNSFTLLGPNSGLGHNSLIFMAECQVNFVVQILAELMRRDARLVAVNEAVESRFQTELKDRMQKMVWERGNCGSWYEDKRGVVTAIWPWNCIKYWRRTRKVKYSEFTFSK